MEKRLICTILIFMMLFIYPVRAYADAGTLVVSGGTIAVGGAGAVATGAIAGPVVVAVFCGLMACGMNISLTNASQQAGMTKTQFLKSKIEQYCREASITYGVFNNAILNGTTVLKNGAMKLGSQAGTQIKQFGNWLFNNEMVKNPANELTNTVVLNGLNCPVVQPGGTYNVGALGGQNIIVIYNNGTKPLALCILKYYINNTQQIMLNINAFTKDLSTFNNFSITTESLNSTSTKTNYMYLENGVYALSLSGFYEHDQPAINLPTYDYIGNSNLDCVQHFTQGINDITFGDTSIDNTFTGDRDAWSSGNTALDPTQGKSTVINPGLVGGISIPVGTDVTVNIRDYLEALQKVLDKIQTGIVARDKETDIPVTIPVPVDTDVDPTIDKEDDQDLPGEDEQTPVQDPDKPVDPEQDPEGATAPLKFDITNIFPFCIPFDIKDMLSLLNAEPVAPSYHVSWMVPIVNTPIEFTIDLSPWNSVAIIARKMELLSFIVGLAVLTRNLIRG